MGGAVNSARPQGGAANGRFIVTTFGTLLRRERRERRWLLGDLANRLKISTPYLSLIETDQRPVPDYVVDRAITTLELSSTQANEFRRAAALSRSEYAIALEDDALDEDRTLASELALNFARLSPEAKAKLRQIVKEDARG